MPLYDPGAATHTWRLRNAADFDFPVGQALNVAAQPLVVGFNPTNTAQLGRNDGGKATVLGYGPDSGNKCITCYLQVVRGALALPHHQCCSRRIAR